MTALAVRVESRKTKANPRPLRGVLDRRSITGCSGEASPLSPAGGGSRPGPRQATVSVPAERSTGEVRRPRRSTAAM